MAAAKYDNNDGRLRGRKLQARRLRMWTKAGGLCAHCRRLVEYGDPKTNPNAFHLDHIIMVDKVGENLDDSAVQVLCILCHDKKTMKDMGYRERLEFDKEGRVKW